MIEILNLNFPMEKLSDKSDNIILETLDTLLEACGYIKTSKYVTTEIISESTELSNELQELIKRQKHLQQKMSGLFNKIMDDNSLTKQYKDHLETEHNKLEDESDQLMKKLNKMGLSTEAIKKMSKLSSSEKMPAIDYGKLQHIGKGKNVTEEKFKIFKKAVKDYINSYTEGVEKMEDILKETPDVETMVESDQSVPVPGGLSEKPAGAPADKSVQIPKGKEISVSVYNDAIAQLQRSLKESVQMIDSLISLKVVPETISEKQENYVEETLLMAFEDGPMFEAVEKEDKKEVKEITRKIRNKIDTVVKQFDGDFKPAKNIVSKLFAAGSSTPDQQDNDKNIGFINAFRTRLWQIAGVVNCQKNVIKDMVDKLNEELKEDLGDYKILYSNSVKANSLFAGWKDNAYAVVLVVDKKFPAELNNAIKNAGSTSDNK